MMRQGCFQIDVISNGVVAPQETLKGETYAVVESGSEYTVQVTVFKNDDGSIPHEFLVFFLEIDGVGTNNGRNISITDLTSFPAIITFKGFNGGSVAYKFGTTLTSAEVSGPQAVNVGTMKIVVYKGVKGELVPRRGEEKRAESMCVPANKKFWQTASVATTAGRTLSVPSSTAISWKKADPKPMAEITLHYHTRAVVELLKLFQAESADSTTATTSATAYRISSSAPAKKKLAASGTGARKRTRSSSASVAEEEEEEEEDDMVEFVDRPDVKKEVPLVDLIEEYKRSDEVIDLT